MVSETQAQRLGRIEEKIDKVSDAVGQLSATTAVIHTKVEALEERRTESHERANRFSEKLDHMHGGIHKLDTHVNGLETKLSLQQKLVFAVGSILIAAIINQVVSIV